VKLTDETHPRKRKLRKKSQSGERGGVECVTRAFTLGADTRSYKVFELTAYKNYKRWINSTKGSKLLTKLTINAEGAIL